MESLSYVSPENWDDKGLDWSNPDPRNFDYVAAIIAAIKERIIQHSTTVPKFFDFSPFAFRPLSLSMLRTLQNMIETVAIDYMPAVDFPAYLSTTELTILTQRWTEASFRKAAGADFVLLECNSSLSDGQLSRWLIAAKNALRLLRYMQIRWPETRTGLESSGYASVSYPATSAAGYAHTRNTAYNQFVAGIKDNTGFVVSAKALYSETWSSGAGSPDNASMSIEATACNIFVPALPSAVIVYGLFLNNSFTQNEHVVYNIGQDVFPADTIVPGKHCKLTVPYSNGILDFKSMFNVRFPIIPPHSAVPSPDFSGGNNRSSPSINYDCYINTISAIGDFSSQFKFTNGA